MVIASTRRERGNLHFLIQYEIASVVILPRNDILTQAHRGRESGKDIGRLFIEVRFFIVTLLVTKCVLCFFARRVQGATL